MSHRSTGRVVGALFLAAMGCYGAGSALIDSTLGRVLVVLNSVVVLTIGVLVFGMLRRRHPAVAGGYLVARTVEAVLLVVGLVLLVATASSEANDVLYQLAMIALGLGSVPLWRVLLQDRWVPRWLAGWGVVGYAALALGALLELFGIPAGLVLAIPGGLFEVVLAMLLVVRGFAEPARVAPNHP